MILRNLLDHRPVGQQSYDVRDAQPRPPNDGLADQDLRVDFDPLEHILIVREWLPPRGRADGSPEGYTALCASLVGRDAASMTRAELKEHEDVLDGVMCAHIAQYLWR